MTKSRHILIVLPPMTNLIEGNSLKEVTRNQVLDCLSKVKGPDLKGNLVSLNLISDIFIQDGKVIFSITIPAKRAQELEPLRAAAQQMVSQLPGVKSALVSLTAQRVGIAQPKPAEISSAATRANKENVPEPEPKPEPKFLPKSTPKPNSGSDATDKPAVAGVRKIIAVASGKGGVGKSTTSVNLALALQELGQKTGILDADIYGPSIPRMLGITEKPTGEGRVLTPPRGYGVKAMSMGLLVEEDEPMVWRGPMVVSALKQMMREVAWDDVDILVVDMPPGTGDVALTLAQQVPLNGAVIVSTPQDIALIDARKGLAMFQKVDVPILGLIENMSMFICPKCGEPTEIFGHGGARDEAERLGIDFLGEIPLHLDIRKNSDAGTPVVISDPEGDHARIYKEIAKKVLAAIEH